MFSPAAPHWPSTPFPLPGLLTVAQTKLGNIPSVQASHKTQKTKSTLQVGANAASAVYCSVLLSLIGVQTP
jgi:hypothetical protein